LANRENIRWIMAKEIVVKIKLQAPSGQATPAPPIGPALGQHGINIGQFVSQFNERTKEGKGIIVPVVITLYKDKSFSFEVKSPPAAVLLKQAAEVAKGSGVPNKEKVGKVTAEQVRKIAETKMKDLNAHSLEQATKIIAGTARSIGIEIIG
jgi:large subunit ribosomal protein L11